MEKGGQKLKTKSVSEMPLNGEVHKEFTVNGHRTVFFHPCGLSLTYGWKRLPAPLDSGQPGPFQKPGPAFASSSRFPA